MTTSKPADLVTRPNDNLCVATFGDRPVTAVRFRDRWCWPAAPVGRAIGYAQGRILVDKIRGAWSEEFIQGHDFEVLEGEDLAAYKAILDSSDSLESTNPQRGARSMVVLYERGIDLALVKARTAKGRALRRLLADHVLPQLRATGSVTLPGATAAGLDVATVKAMVAEAMDLQKVELREIVAEALATGFKAAPASHQLQCLDRDDKGLVLDREMAIARKVVGDAASKGEAIKERGRIDYRLRDRLGWGNRRWCFYPTARVGELKAALAMEESMANRLVAARAKDRQGSLKLSSAKN